MRRAASTNSGSNSNPAPPPGRVAQPREEVPPGFLSMVRSLDRPLEPPPEGSKTTQRRLQLGFQASRELRCQGRGLGFQNLLIVCSGSRKH